MYKKGDLVSYKSEWYVVEEYYIGVVNKEPMLRLQRNGQEGSFLAKEVTPHRDVRLRMERTDKILEDMWDEFSKVRLDGGILDESWSIWPKGTDRLAVHMWFDLNHSKGTKYLEERNGQSE